jgi:hypothetical protein
MKISKGSLLSLAILGGVITLVTVAPALAADADWIKPVEEGVTSLSDNLVTIAGPVIGLCIGGYGVWAALTGRLEFNRIWIFLIAALFIGAGPSFATWFMGLMKS